MYLPVLSSEARHNQIKRIAIICVTLVMLIDRIRLSGGPPDEPEDILSSSLGVIFPDDSTHIHGDSDRAVIYTSPTGGPLELSLAKPQAEDHRRLFSHFLWNAGLQLAAFVDGGQAPWAVAHHRVLELGAGTGLAGMLAALRGAAEVVLSDYPADEVLANLRANVERNVGAAAVRVQGHEWGAVDDGFSRAERGRFGRVLAADCLWMPWQHEGLRRSIAWFLAVDGRAWITAGFHSGREKMKGFFEDGAMQAAGLEVERIWERNVDGVEREWVTDRGVEDVAQMNRWLVVAILKRR
jgi:nicotinamide N-methyltransferase